jgi:hypothetical protein
LSAAIHIYERVANFTPPELSFFDEQKGDFSLDIESVAAIPSVGASVGPEEVRLAEAEDGDEGEDEVARQKADSRVARQPSPTPSGWRRMFCGLL